MNIGKIRHSEKASRSNALSPRVYSYTRFSSPAQAEGDSERRQLDAARKFAKDNDMILDDSLKMVDRGMSGYDGTNRSKGALGVFLQRVEDGLVAAGSILLVENIDRLGREPMLTAFNTVSGLLNHGITIQTLSPNDTFTKEGVNHKGGAWRLIAHIDRAHEESKRKSDFAKENWKQKRTLAEQENRKLTSRCPAWLRSEKDNSKKIKFDEIPAAVKTIKLIFKLKLEGFGKQAIEKKLNEVAEWRLKNGWRASYIEKILNNRAVIGEYQPFSKEGRKRLAIGEPIKNYYPSIIDDGIFYAVQKLKAKNKGTGGRTGKATNVFQNLVKCGYCGGSMTFIDKGNPPKGGRYLVCDNGKRGVSVSREIDGETREFKCKASAMSYMEFEETVLNNLPKLRPEMVLLNDSEQKAKVKALECAIAGLEGKLADIARREKNVGDQVEIGGNADFMATFRFRLEKLGNDRKGIQLEMEQRRAELDSAKRGKAEFEKWKKDLAGLKQAIVKDINARIRLKAHLKEFIEWIEVFGRGHEDNVSYVEDLIGDNNPELVRNKSFKAFRRYFSKRLLSPEGRCYRLHMRPNRPAKEPATDKRRRRYAPIKIEHVIPLAPPHSLAESWTIEREAGGGTRFNRPKFKELFDAFFDGRKSGFVPKASVM